ncbi:MAG TPA: protein kinase [Kofleriaceae bacterium]|nr:protein kinase [Kofleriaceae bacterium]
MPPTTNSPDIAIGDVVASTYEVTTLLGAGGMGQVWAARHLRLPGKTVAIKTLHAAIADTESLARFRREAEIASRLDHRNIVAVHDYNVLDSGTPYLVLEHLRGESLAARIARAPMTLPEVSDIVRQVGAGLRAAHRQQVIHRDLKPQNIFLCPREDLPPRAVILDFGISKIRGSESIKTQTNAVLGTPQYMAPEQATGQHDQVNATTDVFAFGAIVYEMLAGRPAFTGANIPEVVFKVVYQDPPPVSDFVPGLPPQVAAAVMRALAKKPAERFPDVEAFVHAVTGAAVTTGRPATAAAAMAATAAALSPTPPPMAASAALAATALSDSERAALMVPAPVDAGTERVRGSKRRPVWLVIGVAALAAFIAAGVAIFSHHDEPVVATAPAPDEDSNRPPPKSIEAPPGKPANNVEAPPGKSIEAPPETKTATPPTHGTETPPASHDRATESGPRSHSRTLSPEVRALIDRAEAARRASQFTEAFRLASAAWRRQPSPRSAFILAYSLCGQRRFAQVRNWYERLHTPRQRRQVKAFCSRRGLDL